MKIILLEEIENLGAKGAIVKVKDGFARNYLLPKKAALRVTASNIKMIEEKQKKLEKDRAKELQSMEELKNQVEQISLTFVKKAGEEDTLFGSVTTAEIAEALKAKGIEIERTKVILPEAIKRLGLYNVELKIHPAVKATIKVQVNKEEVPGEEKAQPVVEEAAAPAEDAAETQA